MREYRMQCESGNCDAYGVYYVGEHYPTEETTCDCGEPMVRDDWRLDEDGEWERRRLSCDQ